MAGLLFEGAFTMTNAFNLGTPDRLQRRMQVAPWLQHSQAIRTIFFDVGMTLVHPYPSVPAVVQSICAREGIEISLDDIEDRLPIAESYFFGAHHVQRGTWADNDAITLAWHEYFIRLIRPSVATDDDETLERCVRAIIDAFDRHHTWQPYNDVLPTLTALHGRYRLGMISDWSIGLGAIVRELGLTPFFDVLVVSATSRHNKPDPHLFETALQRADALGEYSIYVGDSYVQDILGARTVGIHPILIDRERSIDEYTADCLVIHSLHELVEILANEE
jgi:putative hydrolase of the HAD superfamily